MAEAARDTETADDAGWIAARMRRWLGSGRLQSSSGAYCAWFEPERGALAFEYPEITGYALTWLAGVPKPQPAELAAGRRAADWLLERLRSGDRSARAGWDGGAVYAFDLGMVAAGLVSFGRRVGKTTYVDYGTELAGELAQLALRPSGLLPVLGDGGAATRRSASWSTVGRVHLAKCSQALLLTEEEEAARRLCADAIERQAPDGHFATQPGDDIVMLHPLLYAVEGLWFVGSALGDTALLDRARTATEWCWTHQLSSGGLPRSVGSGNVGPEQLDVTSQAIRAAILLSVECPGLEDATDRLAGLARPDENLGHALVYQPGAEHVHLNSWVTMFGEQALRAATEGPGCIRWDTLV